MLTLPTGAANDELHSPIAQSGGRVLRRYGLNLSTNPFAVASRPAMVAEI
jgi:hypothetical protein